MFKTTALDSVANAYVDKDVPTSTPGTRLEADDRNIIQDEIVNAVEASGQTLDPTGVKRSQEAIAMFLNGVGAQSMVDTGTANAKVLTPVTGASGYVFGENYTQLKGAVFLFKNVVLNTGAVTVDVGQTAGTLLGVKSLTQPGGAAFIGGELTAGEYYTIFWDLANDRFELSVPIVSAIETGSLLIWPTATPPTGYLECDGAAISRSTYASLFAIISDDFGVGDGSTTFNLPDLRGKFPRGWDHGAGNDPDAASRTDRGDGTTGDNIGTKQADEIKSHSHEGNENMASQVLNANTGTFTVATVGTDQDGITGGNETRPININLMYCIKY